MKKYPIIIGIILIAIIATGSFLFFHNGQDQTIPPLSSFSSNRYPNFKGICQFIGEQDTENAANPDITCASIDLYWNQLPKTPTGYDFSKIEQDMAPWVAHGKKVVIRVTSSGNCYIQLPGSCSRTPDWVYQEGVRSVTDPSGGVHPVYWDPQYLAAWSTFIKALAAKYDGDPRVIAINLGTGSDGELRVAASKNYPTILPDWQKVGYSDQVWWNTLESIVGDYEDNFHKTPLALQAGEPFLQKKLTEEAFLNDIHSKYPSLWLQDDALVANRNPLLPVFHEVSHIEEPLGPLKQNGDSMQSELQEGLNLEANYIYVFAIDVTPQNKAALDWAKSLLHT